MWLLPWLLPGWLKPRRVPPHTALMLASPTAWEGSFAPLVRSAPWTAGLS